MKGATLQISEVEQVLSEQFKDNVQAKNWDRALGTIETLKKFNLRLFCSSTTMDQFATEEMKKFCSTHLPATEHDKLINIELVRAENFLRIKMIEQDRAKQKGNEIDEGFATALLNKNWSAALALNDLAASLEHPIRITREDAMPMFSAAAKEEILGGVVIGVSLKEYITLSPKVTRDCLNAKMNPNPGQNLGRQHKV